MSTQYIDVGDRYLYPSRNAYKSLRNAGTLAKGIIYSIHTDGTSNTKYSKRFQFNPPMVSMQLSMIATDPEPSLATGGALTTGNDGVGQMSVAFELMFNRELEVFLATTGGADHFFTPQAAAIYKAIGVQKDIYDLFRVILAGDDDNVTDIAIPTDMSMSAITRKAYDLSADSKVFVGKSVAVVLGSDGSAGQAYGQGGGGANMAFWGRINSFRISINKWSNRLVPTMCQISIGMDCLQARPSATISDGTSTAPTQTGLPSSTPVPNLTPWLVPTANTPGTVTPATTAPPPSNTTSTGTPAGTHRNAQGRIVPD